MDFGICVLSVVPVRSEPSDKSEMVTQLLFGDMVVISRELQNWINIRIVYDNYEGWIDKKQIEYLQEAEFRQLNNKEAQYITEIVELVQETEYGRLIPLLIGSSVTGIEDNQFTYGKKKFRYDGQLSDTLQNVNFRKILENAYLFLNAPYLWGGKTPFGIDCSGFTQVIYKLNGIRLLRDAEQQATIGEPISLLEEAQPGDLLFFDNAEGKIIHVGILTERQKIIHASGKVRIDHVDHHGIYNNELQKYTHNLRLIKRLI
jgi:hypothetical protein